MGNTDEQEKGSGWFSRGAAGGFADRLQQAGHAAGVLRGGHNGSDGTVHHHGDHGKHHDHHRDSGRHDHEKENHHQEAQAENHRPQKNRRPHQGDAAHQRAHRQPHATAHHHADLPPAEAKAFLTLYNGAMDKYAQMQDYHVESRIQYSISIEGEKTDIFDMATVLYKQGSGSNRFLNYSISGSTFGNPIPVSAAYMDGVHLYANNAGEITVQPFDQDTFDYAFDMVLSEDIKESDILDLKKSGNAYVFAMRPGEDELADMEQTLGCQCQNLGASVTATFTSDGYLLKMDEIITGDIGIEQEGVMSWFSLNMHSTITIDKPGQPVTVPRPDWVPADADNT